MYEAILTFAVLVNSFYREHGQLLSCSHNVENSGPCAFNFLCHGVGARGVDEIS